MKAFLGIASLVTASAAGVAAAVARRPRAEDHPATPEATTAPAPGTADAVQAIDAARDRLRASAADAPGARAA